MNKKIEGYWYSEYEPQYPMPEPNILSEEEAQSIHNLIVEKEKSAKINRYRGFSRSRITGELLGSIEYETKEWIWPGDFAKHYVLENRVSPTIDFLEYLIS
jgi:hypothetical protein